MSNVPVPEIQSTVGAGLIRVPSGSFTLGSPPSEEGHRVWEQERVVVVADDFCLGRTPVTQAQYKAVAGTNPTDHVENPDAPVDSVSWEAAHEYCQKLTRLDHEAGVLAEEWQYRLPTEAEWEYACRAEDWQPRHGDPRDVAWFHDNSDGQPQPVGQKIPNRWGLHDMLGSVWEWCQEIFSTSKSTRSVRGGSYYNTARCCRAAQRNGFGFAGRYCGFRLLAARQTQFDLSPPIEEFPAPEQRPPSLYDAFEADDFQLGLRIIGDDPLALENVDSIPPTLHFCVYNDRPEWLVWLLDHGANIELREQDYGATPLDTAVVHRNETIIRQLVQCGADTTRTMALAIRGLAGGFEYDARLNREGYRKIIALLQQLGVGHEQ